MINVYDVQNDHSSILGTASRDGTRDVIVINSDIPKDWQNVTRYATPAGLQMIMQ